MADSDPVRCDDPAIRQIPQFAIPRDGGDANSIAAFGMAVRDVFHIARVDPADPAEVETLAWHLGTAMFGRFAGPALRFDRPATLVASSGLDHLLVQYYETGGFTGDAGGEPVAVRAGDICVFDLADTLSTTTSAFRNLSLLLPRASIAPIVGDIASLHGMVVPAGSAVGGLLCDHLRSVARRLPGLTTAEATLAAHATVTLTAMVLASERRREGRSRTPSCPRSALLRINRLIDAEIGNPALDAERIAHVAGVSRAALYRLFAPAGGVARHIRRRRLSGAALELADPLRRVRVGEVAQRWGFATDRSFSRAFQQAFGIAPSDARERCLAFFTPGNGASETDPRDFAGWMRSLHAAGPAGDQP
ncbi:hypothetical protein ASG37_16140 [Sphingomonas sp. Leaf407]|uniref:helix-turn-helix domain-containing protein n=1 Tax=unclassified Sphingomonas TaxID=196159 RepID=UPI0006F98A60|nr:MULTISPECIES: helix-turn-helix domain-containing protein [unclassified Sphingomonas]KQN34838.1 hypothetical protein ASE97_15400 [Sphingomonas sp. Leaf42]KQT25390.1 hypothetical protein ASG37_16140 [Sphingomonas sp. Leaf407]